MVMGNRLLIQLEKQQQQETPSIRTTDERCFPWGLIEMNLYVQNKLHCTVLHCKRADERTEGGFIEEIPVHSRIYARAF